MEALLKWGIENSSKTPESTVVPERDPKKLDPAIIDHILGKSDAVLMKEFLSIAMDKARSDEARCEALDEFELLVEQIDNAINLENLQMYPQLIDLATKETSEEIRAMAFWILGTAVQNNPKAQDSLMKHSPLPIYLQTISEDNLTKQLKSRALYALSAILRQNVLAVKKLLDSNQSQFNQAILSLLNYKSAEKPDLKQKCLFLLYALLLQDKPQQGLEQEMSNRFKTDIEQKTRSEWSTDGLFIQSTPSDIWIKVAEDHELTDLHLQCLGAVLSRSNSDLKSSVSSDAKLRIRNKLEEFSVADIPEGWELLKAL